MELIKLVKGNEEFGLPQQVAMCYVGSKVYSENGTKTEYTLRGVDSEGFFIAEDPDSYGHNLCSLGEVCLSLSDCVFSAFKAYEYGLELNISHPYSYEDLTIAELNHEGPGVTTITGLGKVLLVTTGDVDRETYLTETLGLVDPDVVYVSSFLNGGELNLSKDIDGCDCIVLDEFLVKDFSQTSHLDYLKQLRYGIPVLDFYEDSDHYPHIIADLIRGAFKYGLDCDEEEIEGVGYFVKHTILNDKKYKKHVIQGKPL